MSRPSIYTAAKAEGLSAYPGYQGAVWISGDEDDEEVADRQDRAADAAGYERQHGPDGDYFVPVGQNTDEQCSYHACDAERCEHEH